MDFNKNSVNATTNGIGMIVGLPEIAQGVMLSLAGDLLNGGFYILQGLGFLVGFYFIGKGR